MAVELIILFLIKTVIANELVSSTGLETPSSISSRDALLDTQQERVPPVPLNNYDSVIELQKEPAQCHGTTVLVPILNQLLNLLMQDPSNANKVSRISALLQEYLKTTPDNQNNDKQANGETDVKDTLRTGYYDGLKGQVKTKIVFKYDLPSINQPQCKDIFMKLIKWAYDTYVQLAKSPLCENADIEAILSKPYNHLNYNYNPNLQSKKDEYSNHDLLKPQQTETYKYGYYQEPKNKNDPTNIYANYKPVPLNGNMPSTYLEPKINNLDPDKSKLNHIISNNDHPNAYEYGNNAITLTPHDAKYYKPDNTKDSLNYGDLNIYSIFGDDKKIPMSQKGDSNTLYPGASSPNINLDTLKDPQNYLNILMNNANPHGNNQHPLDPIMSVLDTAKTPDEKYGTQDMPVQLTYPDNYPNVNHNGVNQNLNYPYLQNQNSKAAYQYLTPVNPTSQMPVQKGMTQYNPIYKYISNQYETPNNINTVNPSHNVYNYLNKLTMVPNMQQIQGVPNAFKLDPSVNAGVIELTFAVKRATPLIYQPIYYVKFRIPYSSFLNNVRNLLLTKPYLKINPLKLYQELIALSNVSDISPALKGYKKEDILNLTYKNGEIVTAKLIKDDNALNEQLRLVQNLNSGIGAADILKLSNQNNGFLKTSRDNGNSSGEFGISRYGKVMTPYYDLGSSGIGFNSGPITSYQSRQAVPNNTPIYPLGFGSFGSNVVQPKHFISEDLASQKPTLGTFSLL